jgi:hypothetical protein
LIKLTEHEEFVLKFSRFMIVTKCTATWKLIVLGPGRNCFLSRVKWLSKEWKLECFWTPKYYFFFACSLYTIILKIMKGCAILSIQILEMNLYNNYSLSPGTFAQQDMFFLLRSPCQYVNLASDSNQWFRSSNINT